MTAAVLDAGTGRVRPLAGRKGGAQTPRTPVEAPDSVRSVAYAKVLVALGEGEFAGNGSGQIDGRDIYLDGTPIIAPNGTVNFPGVTWEFRPGTPHQTHIAGLPSVENDQAVGVELRSGVDFVRALSDPQLSAVRLRFSWPALQQQKANGDVVGYRIDYAIDVASAGGAYQQVASYSLSGKSKSKYERTHRIDLPANGAPWQVRVRRLTPNKDSNLIADTMRVEALTEVVDAKLRYPNTALLFVQYDAQQFQNIPQIAVETRGRIIRVPTNYDPESRSYAGLWDGTFKWAWTDNPAWVWYDLVLAPRFGLGRRITAAQVDKWELYRIAQYCDQLVPDGQGGQEPRFTCNVYFQQRAEAWTVLRDLASMFRGMGYWANAQMVAMADMPREVDFVYTRAKVIGEFNYAGASQKTRHSMALVSYDEPANGYKSDIAPVSEPALVRRYGVNPLDLTAIGCTRRSEADRRGRWVLLTNVADRSITFRVGLDGYIPLPGRIIGVADELLAGRPLGGLISAAAGRQITLDRDTLVRAGDRLVVNLPSGVAEGRTVQSVNGRVVTVTTEYSVLPRAQATWVLDAADLAIQQYRVMRVSRPERGVFEISGVLHDPGKYGAVDSGARIEARPISVVPASVQAPPASVTVDSYTAIAQGLAVTTLRAQWPAAAGAVAYEAEWRKDDGQWIAVARTGALGFEVPGIYAGRYLVRVRAVNPLGVASLPAYSAETQLNGKEGAPPALASLTATPMEFGIRLAWAFPAEGAADTQRTEIEYNTSPAAEGVMHLGDYAYPTNSHSMVGLAAGATFHFRARLVDRSGNIGPWSAWVMGQSSVEVSKLLAAIAGQISETELGQHLQDRLDLIDGEGPGSVNERLQQVVDVLAYDPAKAYASGETVRAGQRLYQAAQAVPVETPPPNAAYWLDIGQAVQAANALAGQVSQNTAAIEQTEQGLQAQAERIDGVFAQINPPLAGDSGWSAGSTAVLAGVWSEQSARAAEDMALAVRIDSVTAQVGQNAAAITAEQTARADAISAMASQVETLSAKVNNDIAAALQSEATARADADGALSSRIDTAQAKADSASASVQTVSQAQATTDGKLAAMWSVKLGLTADGKYYGAGMGIGVENTPQGMQSQVLFQADRFAVINVANGQITTPFVIQGGQVFINSAVIGDGTIDMAKIATALQSTNYVAGQQGWRLDKNGTLEFNGSVAGGGRLSMDNQSIRVYDQNATLRVKIGKLR